MIGKLRGIVDSIGVGHVILDVNGVGYVVNLPENIVNSCSTGEEKVFIIETCMRENDIQLYGTLTSEEMLWLRLLVKVSGVSYKIANALLGRLNIATIHSSILQNRADCLKVPGVGPKLAGRIISELQSQVAKMPNSRGDSVASSQDVELGNDLSAGNKALDAVSALTNLGYEYAASLSIVNNILQHNKDSSLEDIIRQSLAMFAKI